MRAARETNKADQKSLDLNRLQPYSKRERKGAMDRSLFVVTLVLIAFGVLMVSSASSSFALKTENDPNYYLKTDLKYAILGVTVMILASFYDYRRYYRLVRLFYIVSYLLCLAIFVPSLGQTINGARRWFNARIFTFMPSDLMKVALVFLLAARFSRMSDEEVRSPKTFFKVILLLAITVIPIERQPNFSAVVILSAIIVFMYFVAGMPLSYVAIAIGLGIVGLALALRPEPNGEQSYRVGRIKAIFDPMSDAQDSTWQLIQSLYAVSSGGLTGAGYGKSRQKFDYLAEEPHNDFIFSVLSEEFGFIGAFFLIVAFVFLIYRGLLVANQAKSRFGRLVGYGICFIIAFQALVNIGVAIGLVPTTGITLPFISYGGSSLLIMCFMMGVLLNISRDSA